MLDLLVDLVALQLGLLLDELIIGHGLHLQLLIYEQSASRIGQLRVQPGYHLLGLRGQPVQLLRRIRLLQRPVHRLLRPIEVLIEHLILN